MKRFYIHIIIISILLQPLATRAQTVDLVTDPKFDPNDIISDDDLIDVNAMSEADIQQFFARRGGGMVLYAEPSPPSGEIKTAAQIIWQAAQEARINPEIILTMLQKEQSLIEDPSPVQTQYDWATGYSRCDGCAGIEAYKGFGNQVRAAATRLRYYFDHPNEFPRFTVGQPSATSEGFLVTVANQATAGLYTYNPWRGGARVDNRLIGANYNFYKIWTRYFAPQLADRTLVRERDADVWWFINDNTRRPFVAPEVVMALFDPMVRSQAPAVPLRKLTRYYPLGAMVTMDEVYAGVYVGNTVPVQNFAGDTIKATVQYRNVGKRTWTKGQVVLTIADVAGAPTSLRIMPQPLPPPIVRTTTTIVKGKKVVKKTTVQPPAPKEDPSIVWKYDLGRFPFNEEAVEPGQIATFAISLRFPGSPQGVENLLSLRALPGDEVTAEREISSSRKALLLVGEPPYQSQLVVNTIPSELKPKATVKVELQLKNTSKIAWKRLGLRLGSFDSTGKKKNPFAHSSWRDSTRPVLMKEQLVQPGEVAHFAFTIRAPALAGSYATQYRLSLFDSSLKLNDQTLLVGGQPIIAVSTTVVKVAASSPAVSSQGLWKAQLLEFSIPDVMKPGETQEIFLKLKNTGSQQWRKEIIRLSSRVEDGTSPNPFRDEGWRDQIRVAFMNEAVVKSGEIGTFIFPITAPKKKQFYRTEYRLTVHNLTKGIDGVPLLINGGKDNIIATTEVQ